MGLATVISPQNTQTTQTEQVGSAFDPRIVQLGIELESGANYFQDLFISARGVKYAGVVPNECEVIIYNLTQAQRNYLLSQTSPFQYPRNLKKMSLDVGRQSYGTFNLFEGNVIASSPTQPPDIGVILRSLTGAFGLGQIIPINQPGVSKLSTISKAVAASTGTTLDFQATDKNISNYSFTGGASKQINKLADSGSVDAYIDNGTLVVKNRGQALPGTPRPINANTGMVGIPEVDELGVHVKVMIDNSLKLGQRVTITSALNPTANGTYTIYSMAFELSNREPQFFYDLYVTNNVLS